MMTWQVSSCTTCGGEGEVISDYCRKCGGEGRIRVKKSIKVKIPAGVNSGSTLRVRGEGDVGPRGYVLITVVLLANVGCMPVNTTDFINGLSFLFKRGNVNTAAAQTSLSSQESCLASTT